MAALYRVNDTGDYHREGMKTLGWELTVCNALEEAKSPCRGILDAPATLGNLLYIHLASHIDLDEIDSLVEIGGGYGYVMRDFHARRRWQKAVMLDLSPVLLARQKETLAGLDIDFIEGDFFKLDVSFFRGFDMAILNEVVGDFPTICDIDPGSLTRTEMPTDPLFEDVKRIIAAYGLKVPDEPFNLNIGAILAVERLCDAGLRHIYVSEHSCESSAPEELRHLLKISAPGNPERIPLMGHDEYTIRFSDLVAVAEKKGYRAIRGGYSDFIRYHYTDRLHFILASGSQKDEHEVIRHFVEDLYTYEFLIMTRA